MDGALPDDLAPLLLELARRQPEAALIVRLLGHAAASGRLEEPPAYVVDQILAAIPDIRLAWTRGDALAATAHLKLWTGPLGVTEGGMARG